jgi:hypothetical protein
MRDATSLTSSWEEVNPSLRLQLPRVRASSRSRTNPAETPRLTRSAIFLLRLLPVALRSLQISSTAARYIAAAARDVLWHRWHDKDAQRKVDEERASAAENRVVVSAGTGVALSGSLRPNSRRTFSSGVRRGSLDDERSPLNGAVLGLADQVEPRQVWWQARPAVEGPVRQPGDPRDVRPSVDLRVTNVSNAE